MKNSIKPQSRKEDIVVQDVDEEILIYDLKRDKAFCLNQTSAIVWQACDGRRTIAEIGSHLAERLGKRTDDDILWLALDQLSKEKLIDGDVGISKKFDGMSRRQIIKKIGLGSMAALPVIASLSAPLAVHANSACMAVMGGCACGLGTPAPGGFCIPMGIAAMACADPNCRCADMGFGNDDCVP